MSADVQSDDDIGSFPIKPDRQFALCFMTMTSRPALRTEFKAGDGGNTPVCIVPWVNIRGEQGPWSEIAGVALAA